MTCNEIHELAALAVSDDLSSPESDTLNRHLKTCLVCVGWMREVERNREAFLKLRDEDLEPIAVPWMPERRYAWLAAAAAVLAIAGVGSVSRLQVESLDRPLFAGPLPPRMATAPVRVHAKRKPHAERKEAQPLLVKMQTDDPQVVIYWLVDGNGE